jgi:hypothetical protein
VRSVAFGVVVDRDGPSALVEPRDMAPGATAARASSLPLLAVAPKTSPPC